MKLKGIDEMFKERLFMEFIKTIVL